MTDTPHVDTAGSATRWATLYGLNLNLISDLTKLNHDGGLSLDLMTVLNSALRDAHSAVLKASADATMAKLTGGRA